MEDYMEISSDNETQKLQVTDYIKDDLLTTCKWTKFLLILLCVGLAAGFLLAIAFVDTYAFDVYEPVVDAIIALVIALFIYPIRKLWKFASSAKVAVNDMDNSQLNIAFANAAKALKYAGILGIFFTVFIILIIVIDLMFITIVVG